jgi:hypothetical protein
VRPTSALAGRLGLVVATVALVMGLGACSAVRSDLGTTNGPCYVALPPASAAVHGQGKLAGVRLVTVSSLERLGDLYSVADVLVSGKPVTHVCLVAYTGRFSADQVEQPHGRSAGHLAVVVVSYHGNQLLGTVLFARAPVRFGHSRLSL